MIMEGWLKRADYIDHYIERGQWKSVTVCCVTPAAVPLFPINPHLLPNSWPAATSVMAKSKVKSKSSKKKQTGNSDGEPLAADEYVVGMSLGVALLERVRMFNASLERILKAKVNVTRKDKVHWVSALLHWLHLSRSLTSPSSDLSR